MSLELNIEYIQKIPTFSEDEVKETLRNASDDQVKLLAKHLTDNQYTYAIHTLSGRKVDILKSARGAG